jgi:hypothetical protein
MAAVATGAEYKEGMSALRELLERRDVECRLTPDRALETLDDAAAFVRDRGLVTRSPDCSLPSLFGASHEEEYEPGAVGFGSWPRTKYIWSFQLDDRPGVCAPKIHRGKTLYLSEETARLADPICRAELERMEEADPGWARLLRHLGDAGPSLVEDLQVELDLGPRELRSLRTPLERCGALLSRTVLLEDAHRHTSLLARWDQVVPEATGEAELAALVAAGVRAAVVVPEREPKRWFSWSWRWRDELVDRLVDDGRLTRPEPGWLAAGAPGSGPA